MKKLSLIAILLIVLTANCGFKVVNRSEANNFVVTEILTSGEKRINYKIKNKILLNTSKTHERLITINLDTNKNKVIKEKNIKNEITKYELTITVIVNYKELNKNSSDNFTISKTGDYTVTKQYSQTLSNEKTLIETLTNGLTEEILEELTTRVNDL